MNKCTRRHHNQIYLFTYTKSSWLTMSLVPLFETISLDNWFVASNFVFCRCAVFFGDIISIRMRYSSRQQHTPSSIHLILSLTKLQIFQSVPTYCQITHLKKTCVLSSCDFNWIAWSIHNNKYIQFVISMLFAKRKLENILILLLAFV